MTEMKRNTRTKINARLTYEEVQGLRDGQTQTSVQTEILTENY